MKQNSNLPEGLRREHSFIQDNIPILAVCLKAGDATKDSSISYEAPCCPPLTLTLLCSLSK